MDFGHLLIENGLMQQVEVHYYARLAAKQGWRFDSSYRNLVSASTVHSVFHGLLRKVWFDRAVDSSPRE